MAAPGHRAAFQSLIASELADPGARLAITGATGWLGTALAHLAAGAGLRTSAGRLRLFASRARTMDLPGEAGACVECLADAPPLAGVGWRVAHFAALGKERTEDLSASAFLELGDAILERTLRLCADAEQPRIIFSSSGAAGSPAGADGAGLYGARKRQDEARLTAWCAERGVPLVIARVFNVGGPHANKLDRYALSSIIAAVMEGGPIVLRARAPVFRSYVHVEELLALLLFAANRTAAGVGETFDTCGREIVELEDLARVVVEAMGRPLAAVIERHGDFDLPADWYVGDPRTYHLALAKARLAPTPLAEIVRDTLASIAAGEG